MTARAGRTARALARVMVAPWRLTARAVRRWRGGHIYGWRQPRWWPARLGGWPGPRSPHDGKSVVIFAAPHRYEFAPAVLGFHRGHVHHGTMRPDAADIATRLTRMALPTGAARALAIISSFEGGFDAIQTYDRAKFSWGFIQFAATGGLPRLLHDLKTQAPDVFAECFGAAGIDSRDGRLTIRQRGRIVSGRRVHDWLHDDPSLWTPFLRASSRSQVQDVQVMNAYQYYYAHPLKAVVSMAGRDVTLAALFADSECARAVVCDRAVNRGVGHATVLFRTAVRRCDARDAGDVATILASVRDMEAQDAARIDALVHQIGG